MHKRTHLQVTEVQAHHAAKHHRRARKTNRRRNWNRMLQVLAVFLALGDLAALAFAPGLHVTRVRVDGAQTLSPQQVFEEAQVPNHTNLLWMLRQPLTKRLAADPVIDHAEHSVRLPNLLVLTVTERQPYAILVATQNGERQFWLLDHKGIPFRSLDKPPAHLPVIVAAEAALPADVVLGHPLRAEWLPEAYHLLALARTDRTLSGAKIVVDQNLNLCLNRKDMPQIRLGQSDSLPWKMALADAALSAYGGALSRRAAYIDVSCPQQPVWRPRPAANAATSDRIRSN